MQHQIFCSAPPLQTQPAGLPWPSARLPCMHTSGRWPPCQPAVSSVDRLVRQKGRLLLLLLKAAEERGEEEDPFCRNSSSSSCLQLHGVGKASQSVSQSDFHPPETFKIVQNRSRERRTTPNRFPIARRSRLAAVLAAAAAAAAVVVAAAAWLSVLAKQQTRMD